MARRRHRMYGFGRLPVDAVASSAVTSAILSPQAAMLQQGIVASPVAMAIPRIGDQVVSVSAAMPLGHSCDCAIQDLERRFELTGAQATELRVACMRDPTGFLAFVQERGASAECRPWYKRPLVLAGLGAAALGTIALVRWL